MARFTLFLHVHQPLTVERDTCQCVPNPVQLTQSYTLFTAYTASLAAFFTIHISSDNIKPHFDFDTQFRTTVTLVQCRLSSTNSCRRAFLRIL